MKDNIPKVDPNFGSAFRSVCELVKSFMENERYYLSPEYQEAQIRIDFINKFFTALGWDVDHIFQKNPYEQEVKVEKGVAVGRAQKRADYAFHLAPNFRDPLFFVEAKKPSRNLKNKDDYFQTIRYGWNAGTPIAVLTDFEEFHILDCRLKPNINDIFNGSHKIFSYREYVSEEIFAEIYYLLSRDSVQNNSIQKYTEGLPKPKGKAVQLSLFKGGYQSIDDSFLEYLDGVRENLAKAFKKNDVSLNGDDLTEATQKTVDRLVFMRFLEDKLIEPVNHVSNFGNRHDAWIDFISSSRMMDSKYNGVVFKPHFIDKKEFPGPADDVFKDICEDICHLNSPYDFNAIPIHILGSIYEQFLGKVVHCTDKRVKIEEKPEVRKAGGVYYTPKYIVDYIVKNTVGKLIEGKTPEQISKLRFADIACGSGSFLIGAFDYLITYHQKYFQDNPDKAKKAGCHNAEGKQVLSIKQKQKILLNNIYGVDIDSQAVEVTQLSLCLKMLEDETTATANDMQVLFHEKILPDLSKNIVCGNSLVGAEILSDTLIAADEESKLNPMDYDTTFPDVMRNGGFDAVIGNPPYVDSEEMVKSNLATREYCTTRFKVAKGNWDMYCVFVEKAISLLDSDGLMGYIIPNKFLSAPYGEYLKEYCSNYLVKDIVDYSSISVFISKGKKISVYPIIIIIDKNIKEGNGGCYSKMIQDEQIKVSYAKEFQIEKGDTSWTKKFNQIESLISKVEARSVKITTHFSVESPATVTEAYEIKSLIEEKSSSGSDFFAFVNTGTIDRYVSLWGYERTTYIKDTYHYPVIPASKLNRRYPKRFTQAESEKLIIAGMSKELEAIYDEGKIYAGKSTTIILPSTLTHSLKYLLALVNSKLFTKIFVTLNKHNAMAGGYINVNKTNISSLYFREINFKDKVERDNHDKIINLVDKMIEVNKQLQSVKTDKDKDYYKRKCESLDRQIDMEVYKLYALTEEEIKIVEGSV